MSDDDVVTTEPVLTVSFTEIGVVLPDGGVATLWWPSSMPLPPGYTVQIAEPASRFAPAHTLEFVRQH
jgi:hypothetical protein